MAVNTSPHPPQTLTSGEVASAAGVKASHHSGFFNINNCVITTDRPFGQFFLFFLPKHRDVFSQELAVAIDLRQNCFLFQLLVSPHLLKKLKQKKQTNGTELCISGTRSV